jgi:ribosomal protein S18 acetylase RimI-like enzyme
MSTKSRQTIYGGRIIGAEIRAQGAREAAQKAIREADRAEAESHGRSRWKAMAEPPNPPRPSRNASMARHASATKYQGQNLGKRLLAFTRRHLPDEIWLRCVRENEKAWRWYEREGFFLEKEQVEPMTGFGMKYYRWKKQGAAR